MRLLFILFAVALIMAWYGWAIRPAKREQSNLLLAIAAIMLILLTAGVLRLA